MGNPGSVSLLPPLIMNKPKLSEARNSLKRWLVTNPVTRPIYKWRYERHLRRYLISNHSQCVVHPIKDPCCYALRKDDNVIVLSLLTDAHHGGMVSDLFDSMFSATISREENGLKFVDYSRPKVHTLANGLQFEFPSFPEEPEAISEYTEWYKPKPGDTVFDLGANAGISVYNFSKMVGPGGRVICFEPDQIILGYLRGNIARHRLDNVTLVEAAVGGADGTAKFLSQGTISSGMVHTHGGQAVGDVIEVPMLSLLTVFEKYGAPDFCKIDIEGAEMEALESAVDFISSHRINFVLDTGHRVDGEWTGKRVEEIFKRAGYRTETKHRLSLITYASPGESL